MSHLFYPHRHVKIWLTKDRASFMPLVNQLRLVNMRNINPLDKIHLIYDSTLLSESALTDLDVFCKTYEITAHDAYTIFQTCQTEEEQLLISIYQDEITHLDNGGNVTTPSFGY